MEKFIKAEYISGGYVNTFFSCLIDGMTKNLVSLFFKMDIKELCCIFFFLQENYIVRHTKHIIAHKQNDFP